MYNHRLDQKVLKNQDEILNELQNDMAANELACDSPILIDEQIHRYSADHKKNKRDEWYICFDGTSSRGNYYTIAVYGSWSNGEKYTFKSWNQNLSQFDVEERNELHAILRQKREEAKLRQQEIYNEAAEEAKKIWEESSETPLLDCVKYLEIKKIEGYNVRYGKNPQGYPAIILPLFNIENDLRSLQFISVGSDNTIYKTFLPDGETRGHFMVLGDLSRAISIQVAEGYSTASTCHQSTNIPTVVAYNCGNIKRVVAAILLPISFFDRKFIFCISWWLH